MMELSTRNKVIILIVYTATAVAVGRFLAPEKVKIEKEYVKAETDVSQKNDQQKINTNRDIHIEKITTEKISPDGTKEKTTKIVADNSDRSTKTVNDKTSDVDTQTEASRDSKEVVRGGSRLSIYGLAGLNVSNPAGGLIYGAHVSKDILGPISIGVWGMTDKSCGLSVGLTF